MYLLNGVHGLRHIILDRLLKVEQLDGEASALNRDDLRTKLRRFIEEVEERLSVDRG